MSAARGIGGPGRESVGQALARAVGRLRAAGVETPGTDARRLLTAALGIAPDRLTLQMPEPLPAAAAARFAGFIAARCRRQPVAQILGERLFWGRRFRVTPDVLDPRPDTETLVEAALAAPFVNVLDLGTGSGCILISLLAERALAHGLGVDISEAALEIARANAEALGVAARAEFRKGDWCAGLSGPYDLIVSNPPYIAEDEMPALAPELRVWEPRAALTPGGDGLDAYRRILAQAPALLSAGGRLMVEIGAGQGDAVAALFEAAGLEGVKILKDIDGRPRVVAGRKP
ncbi:peptide chain release factor N(5)-glutamine methyltransferase [Alkalilacustris brevis]|uniref:peptide chain release factor N(5)-glutamine methyltransferase n=1 Tax=Alkalilacustris brevis TaxID=2026338 RepID=UPI000E0DBC51|nr:peptide chain release factor N(5)-glutamine methyltransferase [Alkalilacustris brevis]